MMYVTFVGKEWVAPVAHTVEVDAEHIKTGDDEGGESHNCRIIVDLHIFGTSAHYGYGAEHKHHTGGEGTGVAHKDFLTLGCITKHVEIEERE